MPTPAQIQAYLKQYNDERTGYVAATVFRRGATPAGFNFYNTLGQAVLRKKNATRANKKYRG